MLLDVALPRLALPRVLPPPPLWLEIGFGGGEHSLAQVRAHPEATLIACEVFANGICSLLSALVREGDAGHRAAASQPVSMDQRCPVVTAGLAGWLP